jgi:hypothetical protein
MQYFGANNRKHSEIARCAQTVEKKMTIWAFTVEEKVLR